MDSGYESLGNPHDKVAGNPLRIYPNPIVHDQFTISIAGNTTDIRLFDQMGREVALQSVVPRGTEKQVKIDPNAPSGVYQLILLTDGRQYTSRVVKLN
ncbi:MAG: T9SS type A sorting domain-containing protein [Bacteroidota bacterium]